MIAQKFEYTAPKTLDEALHLLAAGAKPLAGGMSLIPMMKLRLAAPERLVDLGRLKDLNYIREAHDARGRGEFSYSPPKMPVARGDRSDDRGRAGAQHGYDRR